MDIPTIEEIKSCTNFLDNPEESRKRVVQTSEGVVVKYGRSLSLTEASTLEFVAARTKVPVPRVLAKFTEPETGINFIVMEKAPGISLDEALPNLNSNEKTQVVEQLRQVLAELRALPSEGYIGAIRSEKCGQSLFWLPEYDPAICGPFSNEEQMLQGMLLNVQLTAGPSYMALLRQIVAGIFTESHRIVFTHADLQPRNIILNKVAKEDGSSAVSLTLIDWEMSGWYPEWFEFATAAEQARWRQDDYVDLLLRIMTPYEKEYLAFWNIRYSFMPT